MDWLLKLLGVSPKGRKAVKSVSKIAKTYAPIGTAKVAKSDASKRRVPKGTIVEIEDLPYDEYEIVGESFYQSALEKHAGPKTEEGANHRCIVLLVSEPNNKFDKNAVRVDIGSDTVGYLSKEDSLPFKKMLQDEGMSGATVQAHAIINGGWKNNKGEGHFGIVLDFDWDDLGDEGDSRQP